VRTETSERPYGTQWNPVAPRQTTESLASLSFFPTKELPMKTPSFPLSSRAKPRDLQLRGPLLEMFSTGCTRISCHALQDMFAYAQRSAGISLHFYNSSVSCLAPPTPRPVPDHGRLRIMNRDEPADSRRSVNGRTNWKRQAAFLLASAPFTSAKAPEDGLRALPGMLAR
jgi:hypothetical protein